MSSTRPRPKSESFPEPALRPRLTILSLSTLDHDGRVQREALHASKRFEVTTVGWGAWSARPANVDHRRIERRTLSSPARALQAVRVAAGRLYPRAWEAWYWRKPDHRESLAAVIASKPHLIHANEAISLPIAIRAAQACRARVLFDAHEYSLEHWTQNPFLRGLVQPLYRYLIHRYAPRADAMITVAPKIAERFSEALGLECSVVMNAPAYVESPFRSVDPWNIRLIHHGIGVSARRIDRLIEAVALADARYSLDLMLLDRESGYLAELRDLADRVAPDRVRFLDPVNPGEIVPALQSADLGLAIIPALDYSYLMSLPNKFFEFVMAGLGVITGPSPEMAGLATEHGLGAVLEGFEPSDIAKGLNALDASAIEDMKRASLVAARTLNAEAEMARLMTIYERLLER
jgi:hypothetical protein